MVGNIFYSFKEIDETGELFKSWIELTGPVWELMGTETTDLVGMKRWLAFLEGGLLPIISLTSLHFFVKYEKPEDIGLTNNEKDFEVEPKNNEKDILKDILKDIKGPLPKDFKHPLGQEHSKNTDSLEDYRAHVTYNAMSEHHKDVYTPEKKVFNVEVGNVPKEEVEEYVNKVKEKLKKTQPNNPIDTDENVDLEELKKITPKEIKERIQNVKNKKMGKTWDNVIKNRENKLGE
jgi:hypothetical protein